MMRSSIQGAVSVLGAIASVAAVCALALVPTVLTWLPLSTGGDDLDVNVAKGGLASFAEVMVALWLAIGAGFAYIDRADIQRREDTIRLRTGRGAPRRDSMIAPLPHIPATATGEDWNVLYLRYSELRGRLAAENRITDLADMGLVSMRLEAELNKTEEGPGFKGDGVEVTDSTRALVVAVEDRLAQRLLSEFDSLRKRAKKGMAMGVGLGMSQLLTVFWDPFGQSLANALFGFIDCRYCSIASSAIGHVPAEVVRAYFLTSIGVACGAGAYLWASLRTLFSAERGLVVLSEMIQARSKPC